MHSWATISMRSKTGGGNGLGTRLVKVREQSVVASFLCFSERNFHAKLKYGNETTTDCSSHFELHCVLLLGGFAAI